MREGASASTPSPARLVVPALLVCLLPGCAPVHEGPQLGLVPEGLAYTSSIQAARLPLRGREKVRQLAYLPPGGDSRPMSVTITEYAGTASAADVRASRDELARRYTSTEYGEVEALEVAGQPAWGWLETARYRDRVTSVGFTAVVTIGPQCYSVEVSASDPRRQDPAYLREVATSFRVLTQSDYDAWILIVGGLVLGGILALAWRSQQRARDRRGDTVSRLLRR